PKTISVIGFVATFAVMFKLDMVSMVGSFVVMGGIFLLLARREIKISSGNVWDGVWTSVVLKGLNRLSHSSAQERNWRPNILLFSGGTKKRPYMVEFAESMIGKLGTLTNFDLIENKSSKKLFSAQEQIPAGKSKTSGSIFTRQHECADVYNGIETITKVYGFSGMEPNTVLMGWGANTHSPEKLSNLIDEINNSGMNLLMLNYDSNVGYGDYSQIDIWLDKSDNYGSMAMAMIKFLLNSEVWSEAKVRFLAVESDSAKADILFKDLYRILDENRISADVKVVNNSVEQQQFNEIILRESADADLIFLGLPSSGSDKNELYINKINELCEKLGTVLLVKASSYFDALPISFSSKSKSSKSDIAELQVDIDSIEADLPALDFPDNKTAANALSTFNDKLETITNSVFNDKIINIFKARRGLIEDIKSLSLKYLAEIGRYADKGSAQQKLNAVRKAKRDILFHIDKLVSVYIASSQPYQKQLLEEAAEFIDKELFNPVKEAPELISVYYKQSNFKKNKADGSCLRRMKFRKRMSYLFSSKDVKLNIEFRLLSEFFTNKIRYSAYTDFLRQFGIDNYRDNFAGEKIINYIHDSLLVLESSINKNEFSADIIAAEKDNTVRVTD
ncbi:MAG: hypothetical protein KAH48_10675, partial [Chlorobi bacterium]|nr:hypothetical protein [Chlorobiota bacterium]